MFTPLDKICICVPNRFEVTQKLHVILLPLVYDLGKVSRGREMNGEIFYASLVRSTDFEQIYCHPNLSNMYLPEQGQVNFLTNIYWHQLPQTEWSIFFISSKRFL